MEFYGLHAKGGGGFQKKRLSADYADFAERREAASFPKPREVAGVSQPARGEVFCLSEICVIRVIGG